MPRCLTPGTVAAMRVIDLNADLGEGMAGDAALLAVVTSANIACGGHAGDDATMRATVAAARKHQVVIGAHPGWPDRDNFGRQPMTMDADQLADVLLGQIEALRTVAAAHDWPVRYVKLHGALSNQVAADEALADVTARILVRTGLGWLVMPGTAMHRAALSHGVHFRCEAFADRTYDASGLLTPRSQPGAVLHDAPSIAARAVEMVKRQALPLAHGSWGPARVDSLCVHGDTPDAVAIAVAVRRALADSGVRIAALDW